VDLLGRQALAACGGMMLVLPLVMIATIASSPQPCSQVLSVRLGAPTAGLPLPSGPWQAAQAANLALPCWAATSLLGLPDRLST
jgi:hypothetical protein